MAYDMTFRGGDPDLGTRSVQGFVEPVEKDLDDKHPDEQAGDEAQPLHIGKEEKDDQRDDDDERGGVVDADDAAVSAVIGRDPVDPCR